MSAEGVFFAWAHEPDGSSSYMVLFSNAEWPKSPREYVPCNLCGAEQGFMHEGFKDRYGFPQESARCPHCDLVFLTPRMTREAYARFYETAYRPLVSAFHGREINAKTIQPEQREYGRRLASILEPWIRGHRTLLDVGGSTGAVAGELASKLGLKTTVLDPSPSELAEAEKAGHDVIPGTVEDAVIPADWRWDVVTLCQTVDHLLDPMLALRKLRSLLAPGGLFWVDILDYDTTREIKVDHPYNFTEGTMRAYLGRVGFKVLLTERHNNHVGFLCRGAA